MSRLRKHYCTHRSDCPECEQAIEAAEAQRDDPEPEEYLNGFEPDWHFPRGASW